MSYCNPKNVWELMLPTAPLLGLWSLKSIWADVIHPAHRCRTIKCSQMPTGGKSTARTANSLFAIAPLLNVAHFVGISYQIETFKTASPYRQSGSGCMKRFYKLLSCCRAKTEIGMQEEIMAGTTRWTVNFNSDRLSFFRLHTTVLQALFTVKFSLRT